MTVTTFTAQLSGGEDSFKGEIHWDKYAPRTLVATIAKHMTPNMVDYPLWTSKARYGVDGQEVLVQRMKRKAARLGLKWVDGAPTRFAPSGMRQ